MKQIHELKIMHDRLMDIKNDLKTFEIRYNDRDYKVGDTLVLKSLEHYQEYETFVVVEILKVITNRTLPKNKQY